MLLGMYRSDKGNYNSNNYMNIHNDILTAGGGESDPMDSVL